MRLKFESTDGKTVVLKQNHAVKGCPKYSAWVNCPRTEPDGVKEGKVCQKDPLRRRILLGAKNPLRDLKMVIFGRITQPVKTKYGPSGIRIRF